jgi:putative ABC transport system permease protein
MFGYYINLALSSFKRNKVLTAVMVALIGVGVAATMTTFAALRAVSGDPVPGKSARLFVPQLDNWGPANRGADGEPPMLFSYIDAMALLRADVAPRRTVSYPVRFPVVPVGGGQAPLQVRGYAVTTDFFSMFEVPFRYGGSWPGSAGGSNAVVIGGRLNQLLFGGIDSVGRQLRLGGRDYRVVGILGDWNPQPRFYAGADIHAVGDRGEAPDVFVPFAQATAGQVETAGSMMCLPGYDDSGWKALLASECGWISAWVSLPGVADEQRYRAFLEGYAAEQQRLGRFQWAPNVRLRSLPQWLEKVRAVPQEVRVALLLAIGLQLVCLLNTLGLLLAKFMRRHGEIGTRRALGASRLAIGAQFLTEAGLVGVAGGVLGLVLTTASASRVGGLFGPKIAHLTEVDGQLLVLTLLVSMAATVLTALYPVWCAARIQPALQLKSN